MRGLGVGGDYMKHIDRVMVYEFKRFLNEVGCPFDFNQGKWTFTLPNDALIYLGSAEAPLSLEGAHVNGFAWMDEAGKMPRLAWDTVQRRTAYYDAPILITTVPYFTNWLKSDIYDRWKAGDDDIEWINCKSSDNLKYPKERIERARRTWRPEKFAAYYLGEFARPFGLIYPEPYDDELIVPAFDVPQDWPSFSGHDFGINDPTTGLWGRLDVNGEAGVEDCLYLVAEYEVGEMTLEDHVHVWRRLGLDYTDASWGDPREPDMLLRSQAIGFPIMASPDRNSIVYGIDRVFDRMATGRIKVFRGLDTFIDYRSQYVWATDRNDEDRLLDKPKDPQPARHLMDALRYLVVGLDAYGLGAATPELSVRSKALLDPRRPQLRSDSDLLR